MTWLDGIDAGDVFEMWAVGAAIIAEHERPSSRAPWFAEYGA